MRPTKNKESAGSPSPSLMARLKKETKSEHTKLESLSYFKALMDHNLPLACYMSQLKALSVIHGVLESEIASAQDERVKEVWDDELKKLPLLEKDIRFFAPRVVMDYKPSIDAALAMAEKIRLRNVENPVTLLGYLYVFEGSTLGNRMHQPDIVATYHLDGKQGSFYYSSYWDDVPSRWKSYSDKMDQVLGDPSLHDAVLDAAYEAFEGLNRLYQALHPLDDNKMTFHVSRINPEAGNHPIPEDDREIKAALAASALGWAEFPYYEKRYGKRGKHFSDSDTCWLVTLTQLDQESLQKQIDWIGRVLATRGMPFIMLEKTLGLLHDTLVESAPENDTAYSKLQICAETLKERRLKAIPEREWEWLPKDFDQAVGLPWSDDYKNTGELILSAIADEKNGIEGSLEALQGWLNDATRFPEVWIEAVNEMVIKAK